jgi:Plasmid pRiA4b ORF-3-like protein
MSAENKPQTETIATLRIDLIDSNPLIWREIEVPGAMTLKQLHAVVQAAMEWDDAHLWEFTFGRERIGSSRAAAGPLRSCSGHASLSSATPMTWAIAGNTAHPDQTSRYRSSLGLPALCRRRTPRRKTAAASPVSMRNSKPSPIRTVPITTTPRSGSATSSEPLRRSAYQRPPRAYRQPPPIGLSQKQTAVIS